MENLTPRELELAKLVAQGFSNKQIAERLRLARQTVKNHVQAAFRKLEVTNRVELSLRLAGKTVEDLRRRFVPVDIAASPRSPAVSNRRSGSLLNSFGEPAARNRHMSTEAGK